jgi:hypothetical protein
MIWQQWAFLPSPFLIFPFSIIPFSFRFICLVIFPKMPWCAGWWTHLFTFMVMLLPYSILTHFFDCGCRVRRFKIAPLALGVPRYTDLSSYTFIMPYLLYTFFLVKKYEAYNLTLGSSCFLSIPLHPISYSISLDPACDIKNNYGQYIMHMLI